MDAIENLSEREVTLSAQCVESKDDRFNTDERWEWDDLIF